MFGIEDGVKLRLNNNYGIDLGGKLVSRWSNMGVFVWYLVEVFMVLNLILWIRFFKEGIFVIWKNMKDMYNNRW